MKTKAFTTPARLMTAALTLAATACAGDQAQSDPAEARAAEEVARSATQELMETQRPEPIDVTTMGFNLGDPDAARILVIEFSDYACGYCRRFHLETFRNLQRDFVQTGDVAWKYIPFELGIFSNGREGGVAGQCAAPQGRFFEMSDLLFERQADWKNESEPNSIFLGFARDLGMDVGAYEACLGSEEAESQVRFNTRVAQQIGIRGTPTFFVNGFPLQGALPEDVFREMLTNALDEIGAGGGGAP
jgi:protein-disulfide isomerase